MRKAPDRQVFTQRFVEKLPVSRTRTHYYDKDIRGFGVRVEPSGRKSFFFFAKANGKPEFRALGQFPDINVGQARTAAKLWAGKLSNWKLRGFEGPSPFEREKKEKSKAPTFQQLVEAYIDRKVKVDANRPEHAEVNVRWMVKTYFSAWTGKPIDSIRIEDVLALRNSLGARHYLANRLIEFIRAMFNWAAGRKEGKVNLWPVENPTKDIELYSEEKRDRFLQPDELLRFNDALKNESSIDLRHFLTLAVATGARKGNLLAARWADISFERANWRIPLSKNGEGYDVTLTAGALDVLKRRRAQVPASCEFVFPSHSKSGHLVDLKKRWDEFRKRAGIRDVRIHDLRRTCGSYLAIAGIPLQQIGAALGHKSLQSTEIYARLNSEAIREAREAGTAKMGQLMRAAKKRQAAEQKLLTAVAHG